MFTDFGYAALGVPRNQAIPANADPAYFDLGLCGPERRDLTARGRILRDVQSADTAKCGVEAKLLPQWIFPHAARCGGVLRGPRYEPGKVLSGRRRRGCAEITIDLPAASIGNVSQERPFGGQPVLTGQDVDDLVAFLRTADGWLQSRPVSLPVTGGWFQQDRGVGKRFPGTLIALLCLLQAEIAYCLQSCQFRFLAPEFSSSR